jgi:hypothetical protein
MRTRWRCAVCEAVNDGGETCSACGAKVTQTVIQPTAAESTSTPEAALGDKFATEIPVRELPRRKPESDATDGGPYEIYDFFDVPVADRDVTYEPIDTRPRVRVYGCCLPIALGMLLAFLGAVTLLGHVIIGAP